MSITETADKHLAELQAMPPLEAALVKGAVIHISRILSLMTEDNATRVLRMLNEAHESTYEEPKS